MVTSDFELNLSIEQIIVTYIFSNFIYEAIFYQFIRHLIWLFFKEFLFPLFQKNVMQTNQKSDNLQYNTLVHWAVGTNDSLGLRLVDQESDIPCIFFHNFL